MECIHAGVQICLEVSPHAYMVYRHTSDKIGRRWYTSTSPSMHMLMKPSMPTDALLIELWQPLSARMSRKPPPESP